MKTLEVPVIGFVPISGWLYLDGEQWKVDETLISVSIPSGGFHYKFSSSGPESHLYPLPFNIKFIKSKFNGYSFAISSEGSFFFTMDMGTGLVWVVGSVVGNSSTVWLKHSVSLPAITSSTYPTLPREGWMYLLDGIWYEAPNLIATPLTNVMTTRKMQSTRKFISTHIEGLTTANYYTTRRNNFRKRILKKRELLYKFLQKIKYN